MQLNITEGIVHFVSTKLNVGQLTYWKIRTEMENLKP